MVSDHFPVMLEEVVAALSPQDGEVYVDGTFGAGGYTTAFLEAADCTVIAIDRDPQAVRYAQKLQERFGERFVFLRGCFGDALRLVHDAGYSCVDGFVLDVGVSSMQIDRADRGFSFRFDGPLDMRMTSDGDGEMASDIVNKTPEEDLANILYRYGDEHYSRRIARAIVRARAEERIATTFDLKKIVHSVLPPNPKDKIDPATKTFQALRIAVNDELGQLQNGLNAAECLLSKGGRLVVVSFHSLEDGMVKTFLYDRSGRHVNSSRHLPPNAPVDVFPTFSLPSRKAVLPSEGEVQINTRSRSAKMRVAIRTHHQVKQVEVS